MRKLDSASYSPSSLLSKAALAWLFLRLTSASRDRASASVSTARAVGVGPPPLGASPLGVDLPQPPATSAGSNPAITTAARHTSVIGPPNTRWPRRYNRPATIVVPLPPCGSGRGGSAPVAPPDHPVPAARPGRGAGSRGGLPGRTSPSAASTRRTVGSDTCTRSIRQPCCASLRCDPV